MSGTNLNLQLVLSLVDQMIGPARSSFAELGKLAGSVGSPSSTSWTEQGKAASWAAQQVKAYTVSVGDAGNIANLLKPAPWVEQQQAVTKAKDQVEDYKESVGGIRGLLGEATTAMLGFVAAHAGLKLAQGEFKAGEDAVHSAVSMETSGMRPDEIAETQKRAAELSGLFPAQSQTEIEHLIVEARSNVGDTKDALAVMPELLKLKTIAEAQNPGSTQSFGNVIKGLEIAGVTQDLSRFRAYMDDMAKAMNVFKKTISSEDYYEFFKYSTSPVARNLDRDFIRGVAPTIIQELRGSSAGVALRAFETEFVGSRLSKKAADQIEKLGLIGDESKVDRDKQGNIKWLEPGAIKGWDTALHNPQKWIDETLRPAFEAKGMTPAEQSQSLFGIIENAQARTLADILLNQKYRIDRDGNLTNEAAGLDAANTWMDKDTGTALKGTGAQFENFERNAASPVMPAITEGLHGIAGALQWWNQQTNEIKIASTGLSAAAIAGTGYLSWLGTKSAGNLVKGWWNGGTTAETGGAIAEGASISTTGLLSKLGTGLKGGLLQGLIYAAGTKLIDKGLDAAFGPGKAQSEELKQHLAKGPLGRLWDDFTGPSTTTTAEQWRNSFDARHGRPAATDGPQMDTSHLDAASAKAQQAGETIKTSLNVTAAPQVDTSSIDTLLAKIKEALAGLTALNANMKSTSARGLSYVGGSLHDGPEAR